MANAENYLYNTSSQNKGGDFGDRNILGARRQPAVALTQMLYAWLTSYYE